MYHKLFFSLNSLHSSVGQYWNRAIWLKFETDLLYFCSQHVIAQLTHMIRELLPFSDTGIAFITKLITVLSRIRMIHVKFTIAEV